MCSPAHTQAKNSKSRMRRRQAMNRHHFRLPHRYCGPHRSHSTGGPNAPELFVFSCPLRPRNPDVRCATELSLHGSRRNVGRDARPFRPVKGTRVPESASVAPSAPRRFHSISRFHSGTEGPFMKAIPRWLRWWSATRRVPLRKPGAGRPPLILERLEERTVPTASTLATGYRPIDEVGNNVANPNWGTAGTDLIRLTPAEYANGVNTPVAAPGSQRSPDFRHRQQPGRSRRSIAGHRHGQPAIACRTSSTASVSSWITTWI